MDELQHRLSVIAEPNRFRIVELLRSGPLSVGAIVDALGLAQPHVSRHLRLLADAGVVDATRRAQQRIYRLRPEPLRDIGAWAQSFAVLWTGRLDRLGDFLDDTDPATDPNGDRS
ncbi:ArsR/SmtB family transcription factor [Jiangella alkaliphila]|uniref:DNA-binding transcriptional regulator, ArsR family n=1 Tax=Jiangella alkaliphila TaxID=419479 RepID=A0A1H2KGB3_9ACTN|nr:metalloregulator ArsR/SmtB family transcription factor [Jiangella alkaliphila]SDU67739.1 DNA-binding transcriptional regulator, ArsR family [Jiangella alkaliphila]